MKSSKKPFVILMILFFIFSLPGITAYVYYLHPEWQNKKTVNKGSLLQAPVILEKIKAEPEKWALILWSPGPCTLNCEKKLDQLARIRLALGRRLYGLALFLLTKEESLPFSPALLKASHEKDIHLLTLAPSELKALNPLTQALNEDKIFIADPQHFLILKYPGEVKADNIFQDLKKLLKINS